MQAAWKHTRIRIRIISGEEEAGLHCPGVRACVDWGDRVAFIMDGGGSTEFILADQRRVFGSQVLISIAARMLAHFNPSDPIRRSELAALKSYFRETSGSPGCRHEEASTRSVDRLFRVVRYVCGDAGPSTSR